MSVDGPGAAVPALNLYNQIIARTQKSRRLLSVHWELTYRCNEKCTHCYLDVFAPHAEVAGELTTAECLDIVDQIADAGALNLTLSGGEILVRRDFFTIAERARARRLLLRLFTNGILITPTVADRIAALHPYAVEMSVYGATPEVHDGITQLRRSWELTIRAFRLLKERGIRTVLKTPLMRENVAQVDEIEALAKELGAQFRYDITITPKDSGSLEPLKHRMSYKQLVELFRKRLDPDQWVGRTLPDDHRTCGITLNALAIDPYGNVTACLQTRGYAGSLRQQPLMEIWRSSPVWQDLGQLSLSELPVCRTCELRTMCVRCHGLAQMEDGDLRAPALVNCREALARRQVLVETGRLSADYPIPTHLRHFLRDGTWTEDRVQPNSIPNFIPLGALSVGRSAPAYAE